MAILDCKTDDCEPSIWIEPSGRVRPTVPPVEPQFKNALSAKQSIRTVIWVQPCLAVPKSGRWPKDGKTAARLPVFTAPSLLV